MNTALVDQVFEEEEGEEEKGKREGRVVGVEPVLATSYSANDLSQLQEEVATAGRMARLPA